MAFFWRKKKEDKKEMTTLEQVRKAYEDLSDDDKKSFHQSLADRVHESIAVQERADGNEDSQSAEAREHEALGKEHAEGKGDVEELHESDDTPEEKREDKLDKDKADDDGDDRYKSLLARIDALEARMKDKADEAEDADEAAVRKAEQVYGLGNDVFEAAKKEDKKISPKEAAAIAKNLRI